MATTCKLIAKNVLSNSTTATVTFSSIPGTYTDLLLVASVRNTEPSASGQSVFLRFNSDSGNNYSWRRIYGEAGVSGSDNSASTSSLLVITNGDGSTANCFASSEVYIPNYAGATNKSASITGATEANATNTSAGIYLTANLWSNTAAISTIGLSLPATVNFKSGSSFFLYGITKA